MRTIPALLLLSLVVWADDPFGSAWKKVHEPEDDSWKSVKQELIFNNSSEPETLDPAIMTGVPEHTLALGLYEGLVSQDPETLVPRPGVASRWTVSEDGLVYAFKLRKNAKWSNGAPVTGEDFRWSWYRALTTIDCDYAYLFYCIEGAEAFHRAFAKNPKAKPSYEEFQAKVKVVAGEGTFSVTLRSPTSYFLDLCAFETFMPVHRKTVEKHGDRWTFGGNWVGNGPFLLASWERRKHIIMTPNPHYWDARFVKLKKITALPIDEKDTSYRKFTQGEVHWIKSVPIAKIDEARRKPEYFVAPYLGSYFYRVNTTRKHLKDKRVRQALSLAINRKSLTRDVTRAGQIPAPYFCPPIRAAAFTPVAGWSYDVDRARALMEAASYPNGKGFPKLTIFYNTDEDHKKVAERVAQMWRENLGIKVALQNSEWKVYLKDVERLDYDIARAGWIGDYTDPMTFMDMWLKDGGNNNTGWSSEKYDALIRAAGKEIDLKKRADLFRKAESILIEDEFPIIPIYIYVNQGMRVDNLLGWYENVRDLHPFQYMYFEPK